MHAVGTDHRIGAHGRSVREAQVHALRSLVDRRELHAQMHHFGRYDAGDRGMQVGPMQEQVGCTEGALDLRAQREAAGLDPGVPCAADCKFGLECGLAQRFLDAQMAQHLDRVGGHLDA